MNSYSIETQQNGNSQPENSKIAEIYQRMLMGEKSALASLQKIKTHSPKDFMQARHKYSSDEQSPQFVRKKHMNRTEVERKPQVQTYIGKESSFDRIKTINEEPLQESMLLEKQHDIQKEKFRSYIKKKVSHLRNEKEIFRKKEESQIHQIKKLNDNIKSRAMNQSKSYDLVRKKQFTHKSANVTNSGMSGVREQAKKAFESISIPEPIKKTQSAFKSIPNKHLPPLRQRKKIPTENSEHNNDLSESKIISRKDIRTPINLADSTLKAQPKHTDSQQSKPKDSPTKSVISKESHSLNNKKHEESRARKITLPQMRKMRQEFAAINEQEKSAQLDVMQYHQQTKHFVEEVKIKHQLNYRNYDRLNELKKYLNPEPVLSTLNSRKAIPSSLKEQQPSPESKKKKQFQVQEQKIQHAFDDIKLIEETIAKKRVLVSQVQQTLEKNWLVKFWNKYDLQSYDFADGDEDQDDEFQHDQSQKINQSKITEAYSTAMPESKDKKWKSKVIKQYDPNRSFHQYSKSRSLLRPNPVKEKDNNSLNQIDQNEDDQQEENGLNKVTVNSRLKKLLLQ